MSSGHVAQFFLAAARESGGSCSVLTGATQGEVMRSCTSHRGVSKRRSSGGKATSRACVQKNLARTRTDVDCEKEGKGAPHEVYGIRFILKYYIRHVRHLVHLLGPCYKDEKRLRKPSTATASTTLVWSQFFPFGLDLTYQAPSRRLGHGLPSFLPSSSFPRLRAKGCDSIRPRVSKLLNPTELTAPQ